MYYPKLYSQAFGVSKIGLPKATFKGALKKTNFNAVLKNVNKVT